MNLFYRAHYRFFFLMSLLGYIGVNPLAIESSGDINNMDVYQLTREAAQFEHGEGVAKDIDLAIRLYCLAARKDHSPAQYRLGWIYANGRNGQRQDDLAWIWLSKASEAGDKDAEKLLRFISRPDVVEETDGKCILSDGSEFLEPLKSVPDPSPELIQKWVDRLSPEYDLEPVFVLAVIKAESNFNVKALSPKNARGLMQLIPDTAKRFGVKDVWDPLDNLKGGMAYLQWLKDYFDGNLELALAGYNAGENAVDRYNGVPPYRETQNYIRIIKRLMQKNNKSLDNSI